MPVHTDAVQAAAHLPLDVEDLGVDLLSIAAHKFYGPKGVGALYVRRGTRLIPQTQGGGQERGRRSGTENVAGIVGLAEALALAQADLTAQARIRALWAGCVRELPSGSPDCRVTGHPTQRIAGHASFAFKDVEIAPVLLGLDQARHLGVERLGVHLGVRPSHRTCWWRWACSREWLFGALRLTFGIDNSPADIDVLLEAIPPLVATAATARRCVRWHEWQSSEFYAA